MSLPSATLSRRVFVPALVTATIILGVVGFGKPTVSDNGFTLGTPVTGEKAISLSNADIMAADAAKGPRKEIFIKREFEIPGREHRPQNPASLFAPQIAPGAAKKSSTSTAGGVAGPNFSQTVGLNWDGVTGPSETGSFPPDSMGAAGPGQFIIFVNGRIRSFNKATGAADGVMNFDPDNFFSSVMTPLGGGIGFNTTTDPQIRYDRISKRWFLQILDLPSTSSSIVGDHPNRVLLAVSDAASNGVISNSTVWKFFFVQQNSIPTGDTGEFLDYDSLGVDANALYVGGNMFNASTSAFVTTSVFVVQKTSVLGNGPIVVTAFRNLITGTSTTQGPDSPRGVDNYDPNATEGYIIGPDDGAFGLLTMRRISNPGGTPGISANIPITVDATQFPNTVPSIASFIHFDALDDRLFAAHIRNGHLWTAHNILVQATGVADPCPNGVCDSNSRDAVRWYDLIVPVGSGTPTVNQSGTIFDSSAAAFTAHWYWIPSVVVSGQGHTAFGFSAAGTAFGVNAATTGRLVSDAPNSVDDPNIFTSSISTYNPNDGSDTNNPHRWGDYSFTSLDPNDDMTMWSVQEWVDGTDTYGVEVVKLLAPPPAQPSSAGSVAAGQASANVSVTGTSSSGSGFFDPGAGFANRISASVSGNITVNSVTYTDPTHVTLNLNTTSAINGQQNVTITNPDGQSATGTGILTVTGGSSPSPTPTPTPTPTPSGTPSPTPTPTPTPCGRN